MPFWAGCCFCRAWLGSVRRRGSLVRKRLWRGKDSAVYTANLQTHRTNQRLAGVGMAAICAVLFLPALALRPVSDAALERTAACDRQMSARPG